ncbi:MAG: deoxycytidine triphosphate deaminase, dCTP deaminase [Candidatus Peregrinibacteria bacterium GW2011_GWF2_33_10]|nr:MAG: deoxycytidine triphosphate deaminase, dCTP deaminase [Candidatus Peregrinibacteria bacterium GW2011_GWF2_33_10]OGJ43946.1 MAG: dCTP deaminase [Candidatus Peregrinibacteria bacterium RIFOXYA12_FULL_33_12]OGJ46027.1 MAG: dCTP deaminase [Candidatus Peregrinibacteria bacterium RIFOXYA2_FULL_33_21]OGJ51732.1 MAG: dCTP deaminase [Candidatus Peregrinibacteria bacterium RIFOXYB2_FULL_33_20]
MILSDHDIRAKLADGAIKISYERGENFEPYVGPASLDIRLGRFFKFYKHANTAVLDPMKMDSFQKITELIEVKGNDPIIIQPQEFVLGVTMETLKLPDDLVARCEGRSSLGRIGLIIHSTAGFIDPGFEGTITLEITNINRMPLALYPGMRIGQLAFESMTSPADIPYDKKACSKYHKQKLPEESRIMQDVEFQINH